MELGLRIHKDNSNTENYESEIQQGTDDHIQYKYWTLWQQNTYWITSFSILSLLLKQLTPHSVTVRPHVVSSLWASTDQVHLFYSLWPSKDISGINNQLYQDEDEDEDEDSDDAGLVVSSRRGLAQRTRLDSFITRPVDKRWLPLAQVNGPVQGHGESDRDPLHIYQPWFNVFYHMV